MKTAVELSHEIGFKRMARAKKLGISMSELSVIEQQEKEDIDGRRRSEELIMEILKDLKDVATSKYDVVKK